MYNTCTVSNTHKNVVPVASIISGFTLPDFQAVLGDFFVLNQSYTQHHGQKKSRHNCPLSFQQIHVWNSFHMQQCSAQDSWITLPVHTVQALPPPPKLSFGHVKIVLVKRDGVEGNHIFWYCKSIFLIIIYHIRLQSFTNSCYIHACTTNSHWHPYSFPLWRFLQVLWPYYSKQQWHHTSCTSNRNWHVHLVSALQEWWYSYVQCYPIDECLWDCAVGAKMDSQFNSNTSLNLAQEFYLNNFANKNTFHAILSYQ